jgi:hypothetical protein
LTLASSRQRTPIEGALHQIGLTVHPTNTELINVANNGGFFANKSSGDDGGIGNMTESTV